jgi:DNA invertase Pin-like site-specific DNA recombinase
MTELELERKLQWILSHPKGAKGENNNSSKLTKEQVIEIRRLYDGGFPLVNIADKFGVTCQNVIRIGRRETWKHLKVV